MTQTANITAGIPTIGLCMIVRDEADVIEACLESVKPHVQHWTIVDTGSTDNTAQLIRETMKGIPGTIARRKWRDFGTNRTQALQLARGTADYLLMLDADQQLVANADLPDLTADAYHLQILGFPMAYSLPKLTRGDLEWRYEGVVHEYLAGNGYPAAAAPTLDCWALLTHHTPERMAGKGERYADLLKQHLAAKPGDPRSLFYLARIYDEMGHVERAIRYYRERIRVGGWAEETFYAHYRLGCLLCEHVSFLHGEAELIAAWKMRPQRIEPLRALANAANSVADKFPIPPDTLFVHRDLYRTA